MRIAPFLAVSLLLAGPALGQTRDTEDDARRARIAAAEQARQARATQMMREWHLADRRSRTCTPLPDLGEDLRTPDDVLARLRRRDPGAVYHASFPFPNVGGPYVGIETTDGTIWLTQTSQSCQHWFYIMRW